MIRLLVCKRHGCGKSGFGGHCFIALFKVINKLYKLLLDGNPIFVSQGAAMFHIPVLINLLPYQNHYLLKDANPAQTRLSSG